MKFIKVGSSGHGSAHTPLEPEEYIMIDHSNLKVYTTVEPSIQSPLKDEVDRREKLEMIWHYLVAFKEAILLQFHAEQSYYLEERNIPATDTQLKQVIIDSYKYLQLSFEERRNDFMVIPSILDISDDTIRDIVERLRELFPMKLK